MPSRCCGGWLICQFISSLIPSLVRLLQAKIAFSRPIVAQCAVGQSTRKLSLTSSRMIVGRGLSLYQRSSDPAAIKPSITAPDITIIMRWQSVTMWLSCSFLHLLSTSSAARFIVSSSRQLLTVRLYMHLRCCCWIFPLSSSLLSTHFIWPSIITSFNARRHRCWFLAFDVTARLLWSSNSSCLVLLLMTLFSLLCAAGHLWSSRLACLLWQDANNSQSQHRQPTQGG